MTPSLCQKAKKNWKRHMCPNVHHSTVYYYYFYFILLYNTVLVLPYIDMYPPWVYMRSQTWMFSFKPTFSLSSFTFLKRLFSSCSLSAIRVVSSTYLRLLIFLLAILIPACASSSPAFLMMYSAYKLNKQIDNIQPWCTPFPIWNQSVVPCPTNCWTWNCSNCYN